METDDRGSATSLGMATVAEGIENFDQLNRVRGWGCKHGQGFLLGPPMTADKIEDFIVTRGPAAQAPRGPPTPAPSIQRPAEPAHGERHREQHQAQERQRLDLQVVEDRRPSA